MIAEYLSKVSPSECAMLIIDCQNDFLSVGGALENPRGRAKLGNIVAARKWAHEMGIPVIYTQEVHRREKVDFGLEMERGEPEHCLEGSEGAKIVDELSPDPQKDYVVIKRRYSGFYLSDLEVLLRGLGKKNLIFTGVDTNVCVYATALDAQYRGFRVIALSDCTAGTSDEVHQTFLGNIDYILGEVMTLEELKTLWPNKINI